MLIAGQGDGGGLCGSGSAYLWKVIEEGLKGERVNQRLKFFSGTSVHAIIMALLACGMPANQIYELVALEGPDDFIEQDLIQRAVDPQHAKYTRKKLLDRITYFLSMNGIKYMGDFPVPIVLTAYGKRARWTHFVTSWREHHKLLDAATVVAWSSLSAVYYFGRIDAPNFTWVDEFQVDQPVFRTGEVMEDGGQGGHNCTANDTLDICLFELGWKKEDDIRLFSMGCGSSKILRSYDEAEKEPWFVDVADYAIGGGEAREEATREQIHRAAWKLRSMYGDNYHFCRLDSVLPKEIDVLDGKKFINQYVEIAKGLIPKIPEWMKYSA